MWCLSCFTSVVNRLSALGSADTDHRVLKLFQMLIDQRLRLFQLHSTCPLTAIYIFSSFTIVLVSSFLSSKLLSCSHLSDSGCLSSHCLLSLFFAAPFYLDMVALYNELGQAPVVPIQAWLGCNVAPCSGIRFSVWLPSTPPLCLF